MEKSKLQKLKERGWKVGNASDFLALSKGESAYGVFEGIFNRPTSRI